MRLGPACRSESVAGPAPGPAVDSPGRAPAQGSLRQSTEPVTRQSRWPRRTLRRPAPTGGTQLGSGRASGFRVHRGWVRGVAQLRVPGGGPGPEVGLSLLRRWLACMHGPASV
jgi:hypothetical protein